MKRSKSQSAAREDADGDIDGTIAAPDDIESGEPQVSRSFSIVGIGTSAGGLEAMELFFKNMPGDSGLAFVVVQHLDPNHKDMLVELLQRRTPMEVLQIQDGMMVEPDHVYVIPPNKDLSVLNGVLYLLDHPEVAGPRLTIDFFFRSLAEDWRERSVGVVLSGMGTDGTIGLRAIKERCGAVFVQDPTKDENAGFRVRREIREMVVFARQNLVSDAPFTKLDILSCRNLLIYFCTDLQKKLLPLFHYCLNPGGILVLGNAETIGQATDLFDPIFGKERICRRLETPEPLGRIHFPVAFSQIPGRTLVSGTQGRGPGQQIQDLQLIANEFLLRNYAPVAVLVSEAGDILYLNGRISPFLEPAAGKANWNIFAMAREDINNVLFEVFRRAVRNKQVLSEKSLLVGSHDARRYLDLTVHPILEPPALRGMVMVVFKETQVDTAPVDGGSAMPEAGLDSRLVEMARDLRHSQEELQVLREEMQTTGEELKSSNEEQQSANEELQSLNEELTTSKEEIPCHDGRWFATRIISYRTKESMIDGLVITFLDVTETKNIANQLADCRSQLAKLVA